MIRTEEQFQDPRSFMYVLASIVMSGYDAVATMHHIGRGVAAEGNPFMDSLIQKNAILFFFVKMAITVACLALCYSYSHLRTARIGIRLAVMVYAMVCVYHGLIIVMS